jgi:hypothetical protein
VIICRYNIISLESVFLEKDIVVEYVIGKGYSFGVSS